MLYENEVIERNNITFIGEDNSKPTLLLAHGFGCDQNMWRYLTPKLVDNYQLILFDYVGSGGSDLSYYEPSKYRVLEAYAQDIVDICETLNLKDVHIVGHSISSIIAAIAAQAIPESIKSIVMVCPSPCFLNIPPDYLGGFEPDDLEELLAIMDKNYIGWASTLAPLVMGQSLDSQYTQELNQSFCSTDPTVAKNFARATFFCDYRDLLAKISVPVLLLQSKVDSLASEDVGRYMQSQIPTSTLHVIDAKGHCLHMTHTSEITPHIIDFIEHE